MLTKWESELYFQYFTAIAKVEKQPHFPETVALELHPRNNESWMYVQSMAQNPRLRMNVNPDRKLSSIIDFLHNKWKPHRVRVVSFHMNKNIFTI